MLSFPAGLCSLFVLLRRDIPCALLIVVCLGGAATAAEPLNVILFSFDTLRADHLGAYGYDRSTSPHLDAFAKKAVRYEHAYAPAPWTLPSHGAMLSGQHPHALGLVGRKSSIPEDAPMLAEVLARAGYRTVAFVDSGPGGFLGGERGFDRGFAEYHHAPHERGLDYRFDADVTVRHALAWLDGKSARRPFFLFLHTKSIHTMPDLPEGASDPDAPYHKPLPWRTMFLPEKELRFPWREGGVGGGAKLLIRVNDGVAQGERDGDDYRGERQRELIGLYDGGIAYADAAFGRLIAGLESRGLLDSTIIVVTSDHGEAFLEHRFLLHAEVYDDLLHVPLLVWDPKRPSGRSVGQSVALSDVGPTLIERVGLSVPSEMTGRALPSSEGSAAGETEPARPLYHTYRFDGRWGEGSALREGRHKLVRVKLPHWERARTELYDLEADPDEQLPVTGDPERRSRMLARLRAWLESSDNPSVGTSTFEIDDESREELRALGYIE